MINSPPKIALFPINLDENLIQMPPPFRAMMCTLSTVTDRQSEQRRKPIMLISDCFICEIKSAFMQQILNLTQRERELAVEPNRVSDYLMARLEITERVQNLHRDEDISPPVSAQDTNPNFNLTTPSKPSMACFYSSRPELDETSISYHSFESYSAIIHSRCMSWTV